MGASGDRLSVAQAGHRGLRVAAAVVGGLGAIVGVTKGLLLFAVVLLLGFTRSYGFDALNLLWAGLEGGTVLSCITGLAGAGLALFGVRPRAAALLMLAGAAGVAITVAAYVALLPRAVVQVEVVYPSASSFAFLIFPALALLSGAALAFLAYHRAAP